MRLTVLFSVFAIATAASAARAQAPADLTEVAQRTCAEVTNGLALLLVSEIQIEVLDSEVASLERDLAEIEQIRSDIKRYLDGYRLTAKQRSDLEELEPPLADAADALGQQSERVAELQLALSAGTLLIRSGGEQEFDAQRGRYEQRCLNLFAEYEQRFRPIVLAHQEAMLGVEPSLLRYHALQSELAHAFRVTDNPLENFTNPLGIPGR